MIAYAQPNTNRFLPQIDVHSPLARGLVLALVPLGKKGGLWWDLSVGRSHGSVVGGLWKSDNRGAALYFNGSSNYVQLPTSFGQFDNQPFSIFADVTLTAASTYIISRGCSISGSTIGGWALNSDYILTKHYSGNNGYIRSFGTSYSSGRHTYGVAGSYSTASAAGNFNLYLDGVLNQAAETISNATGSATLQSPYLGCRSADAGATRSGNYFSGTMHAVLAWNRILSASEFAILHRGALPLVSEDSIVAGDNSALLRRTAALCG